MTGLPITLEMTLEEEQELERMIATSALNKQVGGAHYRDKGIQPIIYIHANNLGFCEGNVVKYVTRWRDKNGVADLKKAIHYLELLIELEGDK
jgi:hypothetical protein